jgi:hypothetical protein
MKNFRSAAVIILAALICAGQVSGAQTVTLFGNAVPSTPVDSDTAAVTLGVKFWSSQPGTIAGIRFYRGYKASSSGYTVKLFSAGGALLASARTAKDTCAVPCWEEVNFPSPISIAANTTYVAAYYTGNGRYADDQDGLTNGIASSPLVAPASGQVGGNGVYTYSTGFPTQVWNASNYYVDVSFTPTAPAAQTPKAVSFSPAGPINISDTAPAGTAVAAIQVTTNDGNPFAGTVSISAQSATGMVSLSSSALPSNVQVASINSSDVGTQTVSVQACENGTCTSPAKLAMNVEANQSGASITGLSLSKTSFAGGAPDGTLVGNITVTTSDSSTPTLSLTGVQTGSGNDAASFRISSSQLLTNTATGATDQPGQYNICVIASGNYSNSPQQICPTIQATGPGGAGWQLTFSDEFVCPDGMLECLATYPVTSYSWANSVCAGINGAAGCGTVVTSSPVAALSSANCTGTRLGSCSISIAGATNNGTVDTTVNGAFLVVGVSADQKTISLYMPYSGLGTIGHSGATLGTGPWTQSIVSCPSNCGIQSNPTMDFSNNGSEGWDAHAVTVDDNGMSITTRNAPFTDVKGIAHTYTSGHIQTWGGTFGFAQPLGNGLAMDFYGQPAVSGAASGLWATYWSLGNDNSWPGTGSGGGEIDVAEFAGANESPSCSYNTYDMNAFSSAGNIGAPNSPTGTYVGVNHQFTMTNIGGRLNWNLDGGSSIYAANFPATDPFYPIIDVEYPSFACNNNGSNLPSTQLTRYVRVYSRVTSGACYTSIPAHGTIPHTGTC